MGGTTHGLSPGGKKVGGTCPPVPHQITPIAHQLASKKGVTVFLSDVIDEFFYLVANNQLLTKFSGFSGGGFLLVICHYFIW